MASSSFFPTPPRVNGSNKPRMSNGLPVFSSAVQEKLHRHSAGPLFTLITLPIPGVPGRRLRVPVINPARLQQCGIRSGRKRGPVLLCLAIFAMIYATFALAKRWGSHEKQWPTPFQGPTSTLVFKRDDLQWIWEWEILSGHYPSSRKIPEEIGFTTTPINPALPPKKAPTIPLRFRPPFVTNTLGIGPKRVYLDIQSRPPNVAYPPRPVPGSVADLDVLMEYCDFSKKKFVRDCLEVLRLGAGLDNQARLRRGKMDEWKYIYAEQGDVNWALNVTTETPHMGKAAVQGHLSATEQDSSSELTKKRGAEWEPRPDLRAPLKYEPFSTLPSPCDDENLRVFHMFWAGPFTDKPYLALLSFLFTQNVGLHLPEDRPDTKVCRPQFWLWINPGPAAAVPNPNARKDMYDSLQANPWAAPFLHPRFKDVVHFKLWNTTEQLDGIPELKDEWRAMRDTLFNSGGVIVNVPAADEKAAQEEQETTQEETVESEEDTTTAAKASATGSEANPDDPLHRLGSQSADTYDRMSVILSDMARFVLCHRFGGIYLDADTIFLRDWEELWGWHGAFAYRWSRLEKYNTAVLKMNKNSALGTFLFRTALKNGLDFHPMTVSKYTKDAYLEELLLRLPDALFDSAWLNTEWFQRDRPPQPYFTDFADFFDTPQQNSASPAALGFDGFFKGAYSYHFHNFWWKPFDPSRNWPDLGPRFAATERIARTAVEADDDKEELVADDKRDLDWATVLKRTFEAYIRGERPNMYGEWIQW
ncbi:glycosyltransferase family 32 protein [Neolentinus lepideus HHB14362 ss-1]|uniref:Glycosyltransferase family 32 protein n=1 Tax=Neolentinus lepideus HHB14362 ss-1 TaxID=1314782 RepID=A0A165W3C6_9AGAM|nr:glycosyltransferase family 32 protein [Neolentinus lepideus HHB14362 ss-1]